MDFLWSVYGVEQPSKEQLEDLAEKASAYALCRGLILQSETTPIELKRCRFTLFPTPFPKKLFQEAKEIQEDLNLLFHKVSLDYEFLKESLQGTIKADPSFTGRIFDIYEKTRQEGISQPLSLTIFRFDYMLDKVTDDHTAGCLDNLKLSCVEYNNMPGSIVRSSRVLDLASYVLGLMNKDIPVGSPQLPLNPCFEETCESLATAWQFYGSKSAIILLLAPDDNDVEGFSKKLIEYYLHHRKPRIMMIRKSLTSLIKCAKLDENKKLIVDGYEIAVAYYRAGNRPEHYPTEEYWAVRLLIERSRAIKCPTAGMRLTGCKKIQQVLAEPGGLERFISDQRTVQRIRNTFKRLYSLDEGPKGDEIIKMALQDPDKFVLKPEREGGGNNFFGEDIKKVLNPIKTNSQERSKYVLMERINYPFVKNYTVSPPHIKRPMLFDIFVELGFLGVILSYNEKVLINKEIGYCMRTKKKGDQDGGISSGHAGHDTPYLI